MQDNAPAHRAIVTRNFFDENGVRLLSPWPANSPYSNPIKHLWDAMNRTLHNQELQLSNPQELAADLIRIWHAIPQRVIRRFTLSMRRRVQAVIDSDGGHTRY